MQTVTDMHDVIDSLTTTGTLVELDCREDSDHKVQLFWQPVTGRTYIRITTATNVETAKVPNEEARHAFLHPFCYLS